MQERKIELDTLISLAEKEKDYDSIFRYLGMLINTKEFDKVVSVLKRNQNELVKINQIMVMDLHFYSLIQLERFVDAMEEVRYYEELPYVSQEVEEHTKELRGIIKAAEEESRINKTYRNKKKTNDIIRYSVNQEELIQAIQYAAYSKKYKDYVDSLIYLIEDKTRDLPHTIKAITLTYLAGLNIDKDIKYTNFGIEYVINPSKIVLFKDDPNMKEIHQLMNAFTKNITLINTGLKLLDTYFLLAFPRTNITSENTRLFAVAFLKIANDLIQADEDFTELIKENNLTESRVEELVNIANEILAMDVEPSDKN